ncbi:MAG: GGDEF domain-containing protein [Gemmatimonadaceae bacterium]|nr:GGDEF domain-containing protein [Gemmatimonadaceae bacterium]
MTHGATPARSDGELRPAAPPLRADLSPYERKGTGWQEALVRLGHLRALLLISGTSVGLSLAMTWFFVLGDDVTAELRRDSMLVALGIPLLVAPVASHLVLSLAFALDAAHRQLAEIARRDVLTGTYNRRYFMERFTSEVSQAKVTLNPLTMLLIDADHFKRINDEHGHTTGDEVLRHLAAAIASSIRPHDCLARYGGEEFVAVLPGTTLEEACAVAERVTRTVSDTPITLSSGSALTLTVSVGVSVRHTDDPRGTAMFDRADLALYRAKNAGRNRWMAEDAPLAAAAA